MEFFTNSSRSSALKSSDSSQPTILTQNLGGHSIVQSLVLPLPEKGRQILLSELFYPPIALKGWGEKYSPIPLKKNRFFGPKNA